MIEEGGVAISSVEHPDGTRYFIDGKEATLDEARAAYRKYLICGSAQMIRSILMHSTHPEGQALPLSLLEPEGTS